MNLRNVLTDVSDLARERIPAFVHWWVGELAWFLPPAVKRYLQRRESATIIHLGPTTVRIDRFMGGQLLETQSVAYGDRQARAAAANSDLPRALVALPRDQQLIERFKMPDLTPIKLRHALAFEVSRRSPYPAEDTLFDFSVIGRDPDDNTLQIECVIAPKPVVERAQSEARRLGYFPTQVGLAPENASQLDYVLATQKPRRVLRFQTSAFGLIVSILLFCGSVVYAAYHHAGRAERLDQAAAALKADAVKAGAIKMHAEKMVAAGHLIGDRAKEPRVRDVLLEVTKALPDDSWVSSFELNGNELHLIGTSQSASSLIERLAAVPMFERPHFRSAITPLPGAREKGAERFDIALTVTGRRKPGDVQ